MSVARLPIAATMSNRDASGAAMSRLNETVELPGSVTIADASWIGARGKPFSASHSRVA